MEFSHQSIVWLIVGLILIAAELVLPGFISMFLGMAAVIVSGLVWFGVVETPTAAFFAWVAASVVLVLTLRSTVTKMFPGETSVGSMDEDAQAKGSIVDVVKDVAFEHAEGQVNFRDSVWSARSVAAPIRKGGKARLVRRDNIVWFVEPV